MIWIRLLITCIFTVTTAGSISFLGIILLQKVLKRDNPYLILALEKTSIVLYWLPIPFLWCCFVRIRYSMGSICYVGEFVCSTSRSLSRLFMIPALIWLAGAGCVLSCYLYKRRRLRRFLSGNVELKKEEYLTIFKEYQDDYKLYHVKLMQNDLLLSPITCGIREKKIILPFADYTEKQLRMILEHEMNHIYQGDLLWRRIALVTTWVHWFNPIVHMQMFHLIYQEEVVCDEEAGKGKKWYSQKEYAGFLAMLTDNGFTTPAVTSLCESKKETIRRIEAMIRNKGITQPKKWVMKAGAVMLAAAALVPSGVVSAKTAEWQEDWIRGEETVITLQPSDMGAELEAEYQTDDKKVKEIDLSSEEMPYANVVFIDQIINVNTRVLMQSHVMSAGGKIAINVGCEDDSLEYRIGIKNCDTGELYSIKGSGALTKTFTVPKNGTYSAYVENCSPVAISIKGSATYD